MFNFTRCDWKRDGRRNDQMISDVTVARVWTWGDHRSVLTQPWSVLSALTEVIQVRAINSPLNCY